MPDPSGAPLPWEMNYGAPQGPQPADPYYTRQMPKPQPFPGALPPLSNRVGRKSDIDATKTAQDTSFGAQLQPFKVREAAANATKAEADAATATRTQANTSAFNPDEVDFYAGQVLAGQPVAQVVPGWGKNENRVLVMKAVAKKAAQMGLGGADIATLQQHYKAIGGRIGALEKMRGQVAQSEQTALANLKQYIDTSGRVTDVGSPLLNAAIQGVEKHAGLPGGADVSAMQAAHQVASTELAKVLQMTPSGAGVLSDSARHEAMSVIEGSAPMKQKLAAYAVIKTDMANRIKALDDGIATSYRDLTKLPEVEASIGQPGPDNPEMKDDKRLDPNVKGIELPKGYQRDHAQFIALHPPGQLTAGDYLAERHALDDKYFTGGIKSLSLEDAQRFVDQYNKHGMNPGTKIPTINVPTTKFEKKVIEGATSAPGVGMANAANAATLGLPELVAGEGGRSAMEHSNEEHPVMAALGEIAGSVAPIGGAENLALKGLEHIAPVTSRVKLAADALGNAAYQGERGFAHADDGEGGSGFLKGLAAGAGGSVVGNAVTKGVTPILSAATQDALKQLGGVDLTTFQRLGMGKAESSLASVPLAHGAQIKALVSFNRDNAGRTLNLLPEGISGVSKKLPKGLSSGTEINDFVHKQLTNAYTTLKPQIAGSVDGTYANAIGALKVQAKSKPAKAAFKEIEDALGNFSSGGAYTGEGYVAASERLRSIVRDYAEIAENGGRESLTPSAARDISRLAEQARKQMQVLVTRNQPELGMQLKGVERAYAKKMIAEDATNRALSNEGIYSPDQALTSMKKLDTSANSARSSRGQAFDQPYLGAASKVMGSTVPKKISPKETSIVLVSLGLGSAAAPVVGKIAAAAMVGAYGPVVKRVFQKVLSGQRPSTVDNALMRRIVSAGWGSQFQGHLPELPEGSK